MRVSATTNIDSYTREIVKRLRNRQAFVKNWANAVAMEARATARKKPGRRYWRDLARSIQQRKVSDTTYEISSQHRGATLKQYGGVIRPVRKRFLTIPIASEAKGKTAYELETPSRPLFVLPKTRLLGYNKGKEFKALFVLAKQVRQKPDPWFPNNQRVQLLARREANYLFRKENTR